MQRHSLQAGKFLELPNCFIHLFMDVPNRLPYTSSPPAGGEDQGEGGFFGGRPAFCRRSVQENRFSRRLINGSAPEGLLAKTSLRSASIASGSSSLRRYFPQSPISSRSISSPLTSGSDSTFPICQAALDQEYSHGFAASPARSGFLST